MSSFFISYNKADKAWGEWIAWTLEEAGYTVVIQAWDFRPGGNFVLDMHRATAETDKTLVVLSEDYLNAEFTQPEWAAAFADDPTSLQRKIIPIRVRECQPSGLLRSIVYVDLVDLETYAARQAILNALPERLKPYSEPAFPKTRQAEKPNEQPAFPNEPVLKPWNVPYERNPFFTGREEVLQTLYQQLSQDKATALFQIQAIHGLGGIGKTQTAVEYAYRHRQDYQAVFWVRAETDLELCSGFVEIALLLDLPQKGAQDSNDTIQAVKRWLESHSNWLLIFDNADNPELLKPFCSAQAQGHILLTSRAQTFDMLGIAQPVSLQKMPADEAIAFLFKRSNRDTNAPTEQAAVAALAEELGFLPLALEQAGAFILRRKLRFSTYLNQYRKRRLVLLERQQPMVGNEQKHCRSVRTTWQLNFEAVRETNPASAELLQISAFVAPDRIPYELLIVGRESLGSLLSHSLESEDQEDARFVIAELLEPLSQYSLVRVDPDTDSYTIHRLVQEVVKAEMDEAQCHLWAEQTIGAVTQAFPNAEYGNWPDCDRLLPHAKVGIQLATADQIESETTALLLTRTGDYLKGRAQYSEAEPLYQEALAMRKRLFGNEHPDVAQSLNNLALLYYMQDRYSEAEILYHEALAMKKQLFGDKHLSVTTSLNNLAGLYHDQRRYSEAEPLLQKALVIKKQLFGDEHFEVAHSLNSLAGFYRNQGRYSEAESLLQKALAIHKRLSGYEHPEVTHSLNHLAWLYEAQERYNEAEHLFQEVLAMHRQLFGNEHPKVAHSLNNLAGFYRNQGRCSEAELFYQEVLAMRQRLFGNEHPDVAHSLNNLAGLYRNQGRCSEAELFYQEALMIFEQILGPDHTSTNVVRRNLQGLQDQQNQ